MNWIKTAIWVTAICLVLLYASNKGMSMYEDLEDKFPILEGIVELTQKGVDIVKPLYNGNTSDTETLNSPEGG